MAAYRQDECNKSDWDDAGFYAQRGNQDPIFNNDETHFDYTMGEVSDCSPPQNDAPGVSLKQLCSVAPYVFDSAKV